MCVVVTWVRSGTSLRKCRESKWRYKRSGTVWYMVVRMIHLNLFKTGINWLKSIIDRLLSEKYYIRNKIHKTKSIINIDYF